MYFLPEWTLLPFPRHLLEADGAQRRIIVAAIHTPPSQATAVVLGARQQQRLVLAVHELEADADANDRLERGSTAIAALHGHGKVALDMATAIT
jgi:hypothetical protein